MNEAIFSLIGVGVGGLLTFLTTWFLHNRELKEKIRIEEKQRTDNNSRVFRKIAYQVDKFLLYVTNSELQYVNIALQVQQKARELLNSIEEVDDSYLDGEGIILYYAYLVDVQWISNNIFQKEENVSDEVFYEPQVDLVGTRTRLAELTSANNNVKKKQVDENTK